MIKIIGSFILLFIVCLPIPGMAQQYNTDSLVQAFKKQNTADSTAVQISIAIANNFMDDGAYKNAIQYAHISDSLSVAAAWKPGEGRALHTLGLIYKKQGNYPDAINAYLRSLDIRRQLADKKGEASLLGNLGNCYYDLGQYPEALKYQLDALKLKEELGDEKSIANSLHGIGNIYSDQHKYAEAESFYLRALELRRKHHFKEGISVSYISLGILKYETGHYEEALEYHQRALEICRQIGNKPDIAQTLTSIGDDYVKLKNYNNALDAYTQAQQIAEELGDKLAIATVLSNMGNVYAQQNDKATALKYYGQGLAMSQEIGFLEGMRNGYENLADIYNEQGDYKGAYENEVAFKKINDSMFNADNSKQLSDLRTNFEVEKNVNALKVKMQHEEDMLKAQKQQQHILFIAATLILSAIIALIIVAYSRYTSTQRHKAELALKEQEARNAVRVAMATASERRRIAADMHDDLGAGLSGLQLMSELAAKRSPEAQTDVLKISAAAKELTHKVKDIVWTLNDENDSLENLLLYIHRYASQLFEDSDISCSIDIPAKVASRQISGMGRKHLFLAVKEALNNVVRHSGATTVSCVCAIQDTLTVRIADNGRGFAEATAPGNGLRNMRERMAAIQGSVHIESDNGATVTFEVPLAALYTPNGELY